MARRNRGTKDVSPGKNVNICLGCSHDCLYCYAKKMALERHKRGLKGGIAHVDEWKNMRVRQKDVDRKYKKPWSYAPLMPSSHDITPEILDDFIAALDNFLVAGNKVNITSKPHMECIYAICKRLHFFEKQIRFMFTITAMDDKILSFWEPGAPGYEERMECLRYVHNLGFETRIFIEPILDMDNLEELIKEILPFITMDIWLGKMHHSKRIKAMYPKKKDIHKAVDTLQAKCTDERLIEVYNQFKDNPKVKWKSGTLPLSIEKTLSYLKKGENMPKKGEKKKKPVKEITKYKLHPIALVYPDIQGQHFEDLKKSIKKGKGLRQPIILHEGKIIDGKNRYRACQELGIEPDTVEWNGKGSLADFVSDLNSVRRDLLKTQRAVAGRELKKFYAIEAKQRQGKKGEGKDRSSALAARACGVSRAYIDQADMICKESPDLYQQMKDGIITISQAVREINKHEKMEYPVEGIIGYVHLQADIPKGVQVKKANLDKGTGNIFITLRHENINGIDRKALLDGLSKVPLFIVGYLQPHVEEEALEKVMAQQKESILKIQDQAKPMTTKEKKAARQGRAKPVTKKELKKRTRKLAEMSGKQHNL